MPSPTSILHYTADPATHICSVIAFYHLHLTFIISYAFYAIKTLVFISIKGFFSCCYDFSIIEVWAVMKRLMWTWLFLFHVAFFIEVAAFMFWAYPLLFGWRREELDDIDYLPLVVRMNRATDGWMGRDWGGTWRIIGSGFRSLIIRFNQ
ncbi:hypothetical protein GGI43DRAFT_386649 [Trichoderma evansii]